MCNSCRCDFFEKCSVQGIAPFGWCCEKCNSIDPLNFPCENQFDGTKTREILTLKYFISIKEFF